MKRAWPTQGCGAGLRNKHYSFIVSEWPRMDWFEAVTENFMDTGGRPLRVLEQVRAHYPVALHGVSLSIGSCDALDRAYLKKLKLLADRIEPFVVSDHLCWTGVDRTNLHDLLPLPLTEEALGHVVGRVREVQDVLGRPILLENISAYVTYKHSAVPEWEFLREVARRSGCGILLDLNNVYVNSVNHRFDAMHYLEEIPAKWVGQFHLAGHTDKGAFLFDTHSASVVEAVWALYRRALELYGPVSTLIEWDEEVPDFPRLGEEVAKARALYEQAAEQKHPPTDLVASKKVSFASGGTHPSLLAVQRQMRDRIVSHNHKGFSDAMLNPQGGASGEERMAVYAEGYLARLAEGLGEVYETVRHLLGHEAFVELCEAYVDAYPSKSYNLNFIGKEMPSFIGRTRFAGELPFLADLAELEWRVAQAFHSFQESSFDASSLASRSEEDQERLRVFFQPSVSVVLSRWPVLDLWTARKTPLKTLHVKVEGRPQNVLVWRRGLEVVCELLEPAQAELMRALQEGQLLGEVCERIAVTHGGGGEEPPVGEWFSDWVSKGVIARVG